MTARLSHKKQKHAGILFLILAALFIAALITCNLIANKFVTVDLGFKTFIVSAGVIPYPLTFLFTDLLSEIYGRRNTSIVVFSGFFASLLVLLILYLGHIFPGIDGSPVSNEQYDIVFQNSWRVISSSMIAYLVAQFVDVRIFHWIKGKSKGKHLWLRNNLSTVFSQLVDTILVITVIFWGLKEFSELVPLIRDGWFFKALFAAADTLIIYPIVFAIRHYFELKVNEEIELW